MRKRHQKAAVNREIQALPREARIVRRSRTSYLSYIEETPKQYVQLEKVARQATRRAVAAARRQKIAVSYLEDGWVVREKPDGMKQKLFKVQVNALIPKLKAGATFKLS
ncbi:hypothetical protein [Taibaiella koreensis]|uniref:hypothetical protein n=1 Tax=Taibaiella koreensis TaxID=1268548 RepID=UPI000E59A9A3|nr:hypothetical protein [Taibaiella koreensis]